MMFLNSMNTYVIACGKGNGSPGNDVEIRRA
jgi:hypothetical protein